MTSRMNNKATPGQPRAKVEYRLRTKIPPVDYGIVVFGGQPPKVCGRNSFESKIVRLQFDYSPLQADHRGVGPVIGAKLG